jgi:hypothetical protein
MQMLRPLYRHPLVEASLLIAIAAQIVTGLRLFWFKRKQKTSFFGRLQLYTGLYLALFFLIHLSAVFGARYVLGLDTNFYFGVAGLNSFPHLLFFIPYYGMAILSFFGHLAAIHRMKMKYNVLGMTPKVQSILFLALGFGFTVLVLYGLTNGFCGVSIPEVYRL